MLLIGAAVVWDFGDRFRTMEIIADFGHASAVLIVLLIPLAVLRATIWVTRMEVSPQGMRLHMVRGDLAGRWRDVERMEGDGISEPLRLTFTRLEWVRQTRIPLTEGDRNEKSLPIERYIENWREGRFAEYLRRYAPQVIENEQSDEEEW